MSDAKVEPAFEVEHEYCGECGDFICHEFQCEPGCTENGRDIGQRKKMVVAIYKLDRIENRKAPTMKNMTEKCPPLDRGTRVKTTSKKTPDREWMPEALVARKWGVTGRIVMHHDSHGLCYDVQHDDGTEGCYDPTEFDVIPPVQWENVVIRGEVLVNGESRPKILLDINAPKDGLFLVTVDPEGKELSRIPVPTK